MTPDKAQEIIEWARTHPTEWAQETFGFEPWSKQQEILESVRDHRLTAARSCHAIGKSTIGAVAAIWFHTVYPRSIVLTTATSGRQVYGILWREIHSLCRRAAKRGRPVGGHLTQTRLSVDDDWWMWGFTAKDYDPTTFQGFHAPYVLVIVDEAAGVPAPVWEGLDSAISSGHARMLAIGNPTDGGGEFGRMFHSTNSAAHPISVSAFDSPNFTAFGITVDDIRQGHKAESGPWKDKQTGPLPYPQLISPQWVREKWLAWCGGRREGENDPRWQSRVLGRFPEGGDLAVIPLSWVEEAQERHKLVEKTQWSERVRVGLDVARFGDDSTERAFFHVGQGVREVRPAPKLDTMQTTGLVLDDVRELETPDEATGKRYTVESVRVDADGLGAGVFDRGHEQRGDLFVEMRSGMRANDPERYANRRAEWWWQLREALDPNGDDPIVLPPDDELTRELVNVHWKIKSNGQKIVESKDDVRARIGRSTDKADAVVYANARLDEDGAPVAEPVVSPVLHTGNPYSEI